MSAYFPKSPTTHSRACYSILSEVSILTFLTVLIHDVSFIAAPGQRENEVYVPSTHVSGRAAVVLEWIVETGISSRVLPHLFSARSIFEILGSWFDNGPDVIHKRLTASSAGGISSMSK